MFPSLYHAHHTRHQEDLPFWLGLAREFGSPVLELGCGTGRLLRPLVEAGYCTIGLDHDLRMLQYLKGNLGKNSSPEPVLIAADISQFKLAIKLPLVILPCNTFSTLDEFHRKACLRCVSGHLQSGGTFAFSVPNPELMQRLPPSSEIELEDEFIDPESGDPIQVSSSWERKKKVFTISWMYDRLHPDGSVERTVAEIEHQLVPHEVYTGELEAAGLSVKEAYGDYDLTPYRADAPSLIILAGHRFH